MGSGMPSAIAIAIALTLAVLRLPSATGATYYVGDANGWTLNVNYTQWASQYTFAIGDTIVFNFNPRVHSALAVTEGDYVLCDINHPLKAVSTGGPFVVEGRKNYFICGVPGHCIAGMKVAVLVTGTSTTIVGPGVHSSAASSSCRCWSELLVLLVALLLS